MPGVKATQQQYRMLKKEADKGRAMEECPEDATVVVPPDEVDSVRALLRELMENAMRLAVPLVADTAVGGNWMELK